jgi:hypothetical protein
MLLPRLSEGTHRRKRLYKKSCHGPQMRATQVTLSMIVKKRIRFFLSSVHRPQLGGPHERAMTE